MRTPLPGMSHGSERGLACSQLRRQRDRYDERVLWDSSTDMMAASPEADFDALLAQVRHCRICRDAPRYGPILPHEPRPVVQASRMAVICIASQAPGLRVHVSGQPYTDASGARLKGWLGIGDDDFYDARKVAIVPMGFCFPGSDDSGGDLPPRRECAEAWHRRLFDQFDNLALMILTGQYAQRWHLGRDGTAGGLTRTVQDWRRIYAGRSGLRTIPLPHPSWRNSGWLTRNPWFEAELLPFLRADVASALRAAEVTPPTGR
jgi:uracil-DNA glycosylase